MKLPTSLAIATWASLGATQAGQVAVPGDTLSGYPVVSNLNLEDVPANTISRYWISPVSASGGLPYLLPLFVARGSEDSLANGPKLSIGGSIHGDEVNPVAVVQRFFSQLNASGVVESGDFNGTVIGLPTQNPQGNLYNRRTFFSSAASGMLYDLNRLFPGLSVDDGAGIADVYVASIWNNVWGNGSNVDVAVDLHTLSTGSDGPLWCYADYALDGVRRIAELTEADVIKIDPGQIGTIETSWVLEGVPAITLEIGPAKAWNVPLIERSVEFLFRLADDLGMTSDGSPGSYEVDLEDTYIATNFSDVVVSYSGWVQMDISPLDDVEEGQEVGTVYSNWGDVLETLTSSVTGRVLTVAVDPAVEVGEGVATLVYNETMTDG